MSIDNTNQIQLTLAFLHRIEILSNALDQANTDERKLQIIIPLQTVLEESRETIPALLEIIDNLGKTVEEVNATSADMRTNFNEEIAKGNVNIDENIEAYNQLLEHSNTIKQHCDVVMNENSEMKHKIIELTQQIESMGKSGAASTTTTLPVVAEDLFGSERGDMDSIAFSARGGSAEVALHNKSSAYEPKSFEQMMAQFEELKAPLSQDANTTSSTSMEITVEKTHVASGQRSSTYKRIDSNAAVVEGVRVKTTVTSASATTTKDDLSTADVIGNAATIFPPQAALSQNAVAVHAFNLNQFNWNL